MARWSLGNDEPFDPTLDVGDTGPLAKLFPEGTAGDVTGGSAEPKPFVSPGRRDMLRNALLALSTFGGGPTSKIGMEMIRQNVEGRRVKATEEREVAREERKATRGRVSGARLGQALEAEGAGRDPEAIAHLQRVLTETDDPDMRRIAADALKTVSARGRQGHAAGDINELLVRAGTKSLDHNIRFGIIQKGKEAGLDPSTINQFLSTFDIKWAHEGDNMVGRIAGQTEPVATQPISRLLQHGEKLLRLKGTQVEGSIEEVPVVPARGAALPTTGTVVPVQGAAPTVSLTKPLSQSPLSPDARRQIEAATGRPLDAGVRDATQLTPVQNKAWEDYLKAEKLAERQSQSALIADRSHALAETKKAAEQAKPIGKAALHYVHREALSHPPAMTPTGEVEGSADYVQLTPERIKAVQQLPGIAGNLDELDEIVQRRSSVTSGRPVLFPRSTGDARRDRANQLVARAKGWALGESDPDIARMKALEIQVPQMVKLYGDTANIAVAERLAAVGALGLKPNTAEAVEAQLDLHRRGLNRTLEPLGVAPHFKIPPRGVLGSAKPGGGRFNNKSFGGQR